MNAIFNVYEEENDKKIQKGKKDGGINGDGQKFNCGNKCRSTGKTWVQTWSLKANGRELCSEFSTQSYRVLLY